MFLLQVPFRLTRMMIKAMEVSGIEGNFRTTCENVMRVLRTHKDRCCTEMMSVQLPADHHAWWILEWLSIPGAAQCHGHARSVRSRPAHQLAPSQHYGGCYGVSAGS